MKITKRQKNPILCDELTVGMIVVGHYQMNLILSITKEKIFWLDQEGRVSGWFNKV